MAEDMDAKRQGLAAYAQDLRSRLEAQIEWDARHPESNTWDQETWERVTENDPRPSTADVISVERWLALLDVAIDAHDQLANHD